MTWHTLPLDGETLKWAVGAIAAAAGWLIGRHDKLGAAKARRDDAAKQVEEQRKREQADARRAAKALADAIAAKNAEIDYLRAQNERLLGELLHSSDGEEVRE